MTTTKLSSKGQVIIPKPIRSAHHWEVGQELVVIDVGDGILLKPATPFQEESLKSVAGCLKYDGPAKTIEEMDAAIADAAREQKK